MLQVSMNTDSFPVQIKQFNQFLFLLGFSLSSHLFCGSADGITIGRHNNVMCIDKEREALLKFKQGIQIDRSGVLSSWGDHNRNCCQWHGIHCSSHNGHVIKLNLSSPYSRVSSLKGKVSSSLVDLKHLTYLDLSSNDFSHQNIPKFISSLVKLKHLNLSNAGFKGEIPHQLGNLSHLTSLDLNSDYLNVASLSWISHLTLLKYIDLSGADLSKATDWLKFINNLPFLREIHLKDCYLPSTFHWPLSYKNSSSTLTFIDLSNNSMNNSLIFQWLFNLSGINTHLAHLDLSFNKLEGPFLSAFGKFHSLSYLDLSFNNLGGNLSCEFGNLQSLSYLSLPLNNLGGNLPNCFANMQSLSYVDLSDNQFEGPIPDTISKIKPLTYLNLLGNNFSIFPKTFSNLCNLQELSLSDNSLTDPLPMIVQSLTGCASKSLMRLYLDGNQIWGQIPKEIDIFSSLTSLDLHNNRLNGTISQNLGKLSMLEDLHLYSNNLKGTVTHNHFLNLSRLNSLDLSYNPSLVINIDADWVPPFQLNHIHLRSNMLGPQFPKWLVRQKNYSVLEISHAGIFDRIPKSFWSSLPSKLSRLDISHNKIYGALPELSDTLLSNNSNLEIEMDLSFNNIEGAIPSFPKYLTSLYLNNNRFYNPIPFLCPQRKASLTNLDLSNNLLYGELPDCWMYFDQLSVLHLENNYFSGSIPASIGYLMQLEALHLWNNSFSGEMPRSIENLTSIVILDLGHNSLSGHIPPTIGDNLKTLVLLSLRSNNFVGEIPLSVCHISSLQILDLSVNRIAGWIPNCIYNITAMQNGTDLMTKLLDYAAYQDGKNAFDPYYTEAAIIEWKRKEWSFKHDSLGRVKEIDLSENKLEGEIPIGIFNLIGLESLDLSGNILSGNISSKIGDLTALEYLDLSKNHLSGEIPMSLADLNSLSILDLSYNHLSGKIPTGTQLQGFNASVYAGNPELCGLPLPKCPWDQPPNNNASHGDILNHGDEDGSNDIFPGLYISVILGFIIGFWGICGSLVLKRSWRHAFFRLFENVRDKLYVMVCLTVARVQSKS